MKGLVYSLQANRITICLTHPYQNLQGVIATVCELLPKRSHVVFIYSNRYHLFGSGGGICVVCGKF
ncbi:hypothetical protein VCR3J2_80607 [Vibrio coralliirubri]|nr:hypothetical protein VCR4J2_250489 [Vibrio coralliirubri]CDU05416.1 hypothetical protein VCR3J2_80607 [Vibrio coralliirubri]